MWRERARVWIGDRLGHVWVDGQDVCSGIIRPGYYSPVTRNGVKLKDGRLRPFTFAKLNLTGMCRIKKKSNYHDFLN